MECEIIDIFSPAIHMPNYYFTLHGSGDRQIAYSRKFLDNIKIQETASTHNCWDFPSNATVREELVKCGKSSLICPQGPYYYAYWKDENGKLKKEYIGSKFDDSWKEPVNMRD